MATKTAFRGRTVKRENMKLKFKRDTAFRKQFFTPESFAHPAKMDAHLLLWIVERYTKPGEVILDPMAGMGTTMLACTLGRNVLLVELEEKFCKMCHDNWEKVSAMPQLGYEMGQCNIIQGDARQLEGLVDKIVASPPYAEGLKSGQEGFEAMRTLGAVPTNKEKTAKYRARQAGEAPYSSKPDNIGNLPYGQIDKIVTSPPHGDSLSAKRKGYTELENLADTRQYPENPKNLGNLPYGNIDSIITSPPYEGSLEGSGADAVRKRIKEGKYQGLRPDVWISKGNVAGSTFGDGYSGDPENIGNLKSESYLEAMLQVYQQCHKVLKPQGLMILVTKNFIREKKVVRLDEDTIKLCQQAGFSFVERHERELTSLSFWRRIYHDKFPDVEQIKSEDILVFQRSKGER